MGVVGDITGDVLEGAVEEPAGGEDVGATDALEGPRIAPGTSSGVSIKRSGVRTRSDEGKGDDPHRQRNMICWGSNDSHSKVRCD